MWAEIDTVQQQELIDDLEKSQRNCKEASKDYENERSQRRVLQDRVEELETVARMRDGRPFVLVLIDADADDYIFKKSFLDGEKVGGRDAADELQARVQDYVKKLGLDAESTEIMVRAYADVKNLYAACTRNGKIKMGADLRLFIHGFNQRLAMFDFVDVGTGKEGADNKVRREFAANVSKRERITLLHGTKIHASIAGLGFKRFLRLETVFAPHGASAIQASRPSSLTIPGIAFNANNGSSPGGSTAPTSGPKGYVNPAPLSERLGPIIRDDAGKRLDKKLNNDIGSGYLNVLRENKFCAYYYLRGRCNGGCGKNHVPAPLKAKEFDNLWHEEDCQLGSGKV
ncbi:hypothetical protein P7C71_g5723, partial [Lecanoromycetidae sp. Uapishka_2]